MSEAVRELISLAMKCGSELRSRRLYHTADALFCAAARAKAELSRTPQQLHEERIEEVLKWNR